MNYWIPSWGNAAIVVSRKRFMLPLSPLGAVKHRLLIHNFIKPGLEAEKVGRRQQSIR